MARINIEEMWWSDLRRSRLIKLLGDEDKADAQALRMWRVGQEFWGKGRHLVPKQIFSTLEAASKLLEAGLAEERENGIYVRGSSQYLEWVLDKREAGKIGGKKSAEVRRKKHGSAQPKPEAASKQPRSKTKHAEPSSSYSSSPSSSDSISGSLELHEPASGLAPKKELSRKIWKAYSDAYFSRYQKDPVRNAKVNGQVARLGERLGEDAPDVAKFYVSHDKTFYLSKCHEFGLCLSDAEALHTQWVRGKAITNTSLRRFEKASESNELDQLINQGKI